MAVLRPGEIAAAISFETKQKVWTTVGELSDAFIALLVKLDDDAGLTDADYESLLTPANRISSE